MPSPLSRMRREGVWPNVYRARVARATYSARQSDARIKSHDCAGMNGMHINDCARARALSYAIVPRSETIHYLSWKRARHPITKYTFPFLQSLLRVKNIASGKKLQRLLGNTNGGRPDNGVSVCEGCCCFMSCQHFVLEVSSESEALTGFYTVRVVSPNLALLGA